jgi:hypothetical protein
MPSAQPDWTWAVHASVFADLLDGLPHSRLTCRAFFDFVLERELLPRKRAKKVRLQLAVDANGDIGSACDGLMDRIRAECDPNNLAEDPPALFACLLTEEAHRRLTLPVTCGTADEQALRSCGIDEKDFVYVLVAAAAGRRAGRRGRLAHSGHFGNTDVVKRSYAVDIYNVNAGHHESASV